MPNGREYTVAIGQLIIHDSSKMTSGGLYFSITFPSLSAIISVNHRLPAASFLIRCIITFLEGMVWVLKGTPEMSSLSRVLIDLSNFRI